MAYIRQCIHHTELNPHELVTFINSGWFPPVQCGVASHSCSGKQSVAKKKMRLTGSRIRRTNVHSLNCVTNGRMHMRKASLTPSLLLLTVLTTYQRNVLLAKLSWAEAATHNSSSSYTSYTDLALAACPPFPKSDFVIRKLFVLVKRYFFVSSTVMHLHTAHTPMMCFQHPPGRHPPRSVRAFFHSPLTG